MKRHEVDLLIFDLDGTLVDSKADIIFSVNETLREFRQPLLDEDLIAAHVGYGVKPLLEKTLANVANLDLDAFFERFQELYDGHLLDKTKPFEGIDKVLKHFASKKKVVLTNKRQRAADLVVQGLFPNVFLEVFGREAFVEHKPSPMPILEICKSFGVRPERAVMIGDTSADIRSGKSAGALTCAVRYGYGGHEKLETFGPTFFVTSTSEIAEMFS